MDRSEKGNKIEKWERIYMERLVGYFYTAIKPAWRLFNQALPLFALWLLLPLTLFLLSTSYKAELSTRKLDENSFIIATIGFANSGGDSLVLFVAHPKKLILDNPESASRPLALWLQYATPTPDSSSQSLQLTPNAPLTPTVSVSPVLNNCSQGKTPNLSSTVIPTVTPPTPSHTPTPYVVSLFVHDDLNLVDSQGLPVPHQVVLTPSHYEITPAVLYIRPGPLSNSSKSIIDVSINEVLIPTGTSPVVIELEAQSLAKSRHWREEGLGFLLSSGLTAGVIAALVGFAVQQWKSIDERRQEREKAIAEINDLRKLLQEKKLSDGARYFLVLHGRSQSIWYEGDIKRYLDDVWRQYASNDFRVVVGLWEQQNSESGLGKFFNEIGSWAVAKALGWALDTRELDADWHQRAMKLGELLKQKDLLKRNEEG